MDESPVNASRSVERRQPSRPPLVLIANDQEWSTRSLESILWPNGYAVLRAYTGRKALERARSAQPDLIIIDDTLPDMDSMELCKQLRDEASIRASTPILMTAAVRPSRQQRLAALRAGAWEFLSYPLDAEELMLRLDGYMRAKFEADMSRELALIDEITGLYNLRGLERRARELGAHAFRNHWPLTCVVFVAAPDASHGREHYQQTLHRLTHLFKRVFRISDAVGRLGEEEFAIIAPATNAAGAIRIAERLAAAMKTDALDQKLTLTVGYDSIPDYHENPIELTDLLTRATTALRSSRTSFPGDRSWIHAFSEAT